jgi:hypothetical protein
MQTAMKDKMDWLIHIDSDELLHGSLDAFDEIEGDVKIVKIENMEAVYGEREDSCFSAKRFVRCAVGKCRSYSNGKSACRPGKDITVGGPHDFMYKGKDANYLISYEKLNVLHFDSCSFGAWAEKFKHIGTQLHDKPPFEYYNESIDKVKDMFEVYKSHAVDVDVPENAVYTI